jgi:flagellin
MISINTNTAATSAAYNLSNTNTNLQRSLQKLSSGSRINSSFDDAGGLAVSMKLSAAIRRTEATQANVNNGLSFLQTQDGVLKNAGLVLGRMAELAQMASDVTKSEDDKSLYQTEFDSLLDSLTSLTDEQFNGIALFGDAADPLTLITSQDGTQSIELSIADIGAIVTAIGTMDISTNAADPEANIATLDDQITALAEARAQNGSEQQRVTFAADMLAVNKTNLEAANGRITDVDIASESANLARLNILQQAGTAMLAQANQANQSVLRLLV